MYLRRGEVGEGAPIGRNFVIVYSVAEFQIHSSSLRFLVPETGHRGLRTLTGNEGDASSTLRSNPTYGKMPKFVRRQPIAERLKSYLDPYDFLLWLSEELEANGWDQLEKEWATPIGIALNLSFIIARANSKIKTTYYDDVFGDIPGVAWTAWLVRSVSSRKVRR